MSMICIAAPRSLIGWLARLALIVMCATGGAHADLINLTGAEKSDTVAEFHVFNDRIKVILEIGPNSTGVFANLQPQPAATRAERFRRFFLEDLKLMPDGGAPIEGSVRVIEFRPRINRATLFGNSLAIRGSRLVRLTTSKRVVYVEIDYPLKKRPNSLTIEPPKTKAGVVAATIGFILYHRSVPVIDFRYLPDAATVKLDWDDPWYSKFRNTNLRRHHKAGLFTYLYVEPFEVRHEVLVRLRDLQNWMELGLDGSSRIGVAEQATLRKKIGAFLLARNPVRIDGVAVKPVIDRVQFMKVGQAGPQFDAKPIERDVATAFVGVILVYPTRGLPKKVTVDWELFAPRIDRVSATLIDPAGPLRTRIDRDNRQLVWRNVLTNSATPTIEPQKVPRSLTLIRLPWASGVIVLFALVLGALALRRFKRGRRTFYHLFGAGFALSLAAALISNMYVEVGNPFGGARKVTEPEAKRLLNALLKNMYRAFEFRGERAVYDKLALTASGDLLTEIYLQTRRAMEVKRAGGAVARVKVVKVLSAKPGPLPSGNSGFRARAAWRAAGSVNHWGHLHQRINRYDAMVTVEAVDGSWKITGLKILSLTRMDRTRQAARR